MCPLEQRAGGTSTIEWTTDVVDDSAASKPPKKKKTPHSDPTTAPAQTTIDNNKKAPTSDNVSKKEAQINSKPPCKCMCPLEQSTSGTSQPE